MVGAGIERSRLRADARAQVDLGVCYKHGAGVAQDQAEAVRWYRLATEQGYAYAQFILGACYYNGEGVAQNKVEAVRWYRLAAQQGLKEAQEALERLS